MLVPNMTIDRTQIPGIFNPGMVIFCCQKAMDVDCWNTLKCEQYRMRTNKPVELEVIFALFVCPGKRIPERDIDLLGLIGFGLRRSIA